ncbi:MAG: insulinase family protein [Deltaproteobacteria bacterium]|nr:insulinase family protein [Deltaproteobacteria bacterium]
MIFDFLAFPAHAAIGEAKALLERITATPAPEFAPPHIEMRTLINGMRCFFMEDRLLPLFRFGLLYPGGRVHDPAEKVGLHGLMATLLRTGGTQTNAPEIFDELLDSQAITIDTQVSWEEASVALSSLSGTQDEALRLLFEMLYAPAFDPARFAVARAKLLEAVRRQNDDPTHLGARLFRKLLYGRESPWARTPTPTQVEAITPEDLKALHATHFAPAQMLCAAAGDFRTGTLVKKVEELMAQYPERPVVARTAPPVEAVFKPGTWIAPKAITQAVVNVGQLATSRDNPDRFPLYVMNEILGSPATFSSWLASSIRTEQGLAYETWSQIGFGPPTVPGVLQAHAKTRVEAAGRTVASIRKIIGEMATGERVAADEVAAMKGAVLKQMIFQYEDPYQVASDMARFVFLGYPPNYIEVFRAAIERVTRADVIRVAKQYLSPENLTVLVVGDDHAVTPQLDAATPVQRYEVGSD